MSEHDKTDEAAGQPAPDQPVEQPVDQPVAVEEPPTPPSPPAKSRWRERSFRWRSMTAVAIAGVILGATGGAVTTALVADGGDPGGHHGPGDRHRMGEEMPPGMPGGR